MNGLRGQLFGQFEVGQIFRTASRTITESDIVQFAGISGDFNPLHMDAHFAAGSEFGKRIGHGLLGAAILAGQTANLGLFEGTTLALLETSFRYLGPLFIGDSVHSEIEVVKTQQSKRSDRGIVTTQRRLINQTGQVLIDSTWVTMIAGEPKEHRP